LKNYDLLDMVVDEVIIGNKLNSWSLKELLPNE